ncbi:MAG: LacI family DNA-binding transcriptional regulator [Bacillota bacterium]|nr:LacI family DNA-binding transcriptional regulator [Bacillota bacterium]
MSVTIKDVAKRAGVNASTVSRALSGKVVVNKETKEKILAAVKELNYQPNAFAKGLKEGKSNTVGLIVPNIRDLVFPAAIRGISDVLEQHGYTLILCNTDESIETEMMHVENLRNRLVDGLIFSTARKESKHLLELKENGFPVVLLLRHLEDEIDAVIIDNFKGGYDATSFLIQQGHRNIAIVNGNMNLSLYQERFEGYKAALKDAGLKVNKDLVIDDIKSWECSYQAVSTLMTSGNMPDAIFATSDPKALGVIRALKDKGFSVPADISVIGFDNIDMAEVIDPPLTTVAQPFYDAGLLAAKRLIKLMNSKRKLKPVVEKLEANLLVRSSVKVTNQANDYTA